jgi:SIR2-like domain
MLAQLVPVPASPSPQLRSLAALIKTKREAGTKFVMMLGAGASISSGVLPTQQLMEQLVEKYAPDLAKGSVEERFDSLWQRSSPDDRRLFLEPYLRREPSNGYEQLALAIQAGFFDLILTFNYDTLVEQALRKIGFNDFRVIVRGEIESGQMERLVDRPSASFTLLKLHGSLFGADVFLFDRAEMITYPPEIESLVKKLTRRDIIICGYGFNDLCVVNAFSREGGDVFNVDPGGVPRYLSPILMDRRSRERAIEGDAARFDRFMGELYRELVAPPPPPPALQLPGAKRVNSFKFLAAYDNDSSDRAWFFGRKALTRQLLSKLQNDGGILLHLIGPPKCGKTSLVRAGLMARLPADAFAPPIYLRCRSDLATQLSDEVIRRCPGADRANLTAALVALGAAAEKPTVLILDQFERSVTRHHNGPDWNKFVPLFDALRQAASAKLRLLFVTSDESHYILMAKAKLPEALREAVEVEPFTVKRIRIIARHLLKASGRSFEPDLWDELMKKFDDPERPLPFTLVHLQSLCYLLVLDSCTNLDQYRRLVGTELEAALDGAIAYDVLNFLEDLPTVRERGLVRSFMRGVPVPIKRAIASFIKERFMDLMKDSQYPETL